MNRIGELKNGKYFKDNNIKLYKLTLEDEIHHGLKYETGMIIDREHFNYDRSEMCGKGGIYFSNQDSILGWIRLKTRYIRPIELLDDEQVIWFERFIDETNPRLGRYASAPSKGRSKQIIACERLDLFDNHTWDIIYNDGVNINEWIDYICQWCGYNKQLGILVYLDKMNYIDKDDKFPLEIYQLALKYNNVEACRVINNHGIDPCRVHTSTVMLMLRYNCSDTLKYINKNGVDVKYYINSARNAKNKLYHFDMDYLDKLFSELDMVSVKNPWSRY